MKHLIAIGLFLFTLTQVSYANPYPYKVLRVIDGDTVEFTADFLPEPLTKKLKLRVLHVDTPEKGKAAKCSKEESLSLRAKLFTEEKISNGKIVLIELKKWDKYGGRVLGDVIIDGKRLSELLIQGNYAVAYNGEKKTKDWCQ